MIPAKKAEQPAAATIEDLLIRGDLASLSPQQRTEYYMRVCNSLGLNPMTQPFSYITLNGKLTLYATRACADQLRKLNGISIEIVDQELKEGLLTVHVRAKDKAGRMDEDIGVVSVGGLKGEAAANAALKAVTKAKRRVTLSISGLGYLDETEVEDIPAAQQQIEHEEPQPAVDIDPHKLHVPILPDGSGSDWRTFATALLSAIKSCGVGEGLAWLDANSIALAEMKKAVPKMHSNFMAATGLDSPDA